MSVVGALLSPLRAYREAWLELASRDPTLAAMDAGLAGLPAWPDPATGPTASRRTALAAEPGAVVEAARRRGRDGGAVFLAAPVPLLVEAAYGPEAQALFRAPLRVELVGVPLPGTGEDGALPRDDLTAMRGLASIAVVVPADAPTVARATAVLGTHAGPGYLKLPPEGTPTVTDGAFALGRAPTLRDGNDLTLVALGTTVAPALAVADDLARVGVAARVLDAASVKPFDEAAVLRAAHDTGALLVVEAGPVSTGIGTLVAAMTAENYPVPVRRLGAPETVAAGGSAPTPEAASWLAGRLRDEAFELLRLRGKAT